MTKKQKVTKAPKHALPKQLYVFQEPGETFFIADTETNGIDAGVAVGVYELKEVKRKLVVHQLV